MKKINLVLLLFCIIILAENTGCKKESVQPGNNTNKPPIARSGNDTSIVLPANSVKLNGADSYDPDNDSITYKWTKKSGPNSFTIVNPDSLITTVTNLVEGGYEFVLTIKDSKGAEATDVVNVFVYPSPPAPPPPRTLALVVSFPPTADTMVRLPAGSIPLHATVRLFPEYNGMPKVVISSIEWSKVAGPVSFKFQSTNNLSTQVSDLTAGVYAFQCKVVDTAGRTGSSIYIVSVSNPQVAEEEIIVSNVSWTEGNMGWMWLFANFTLPPDRSVKKVFVKQDCDSVFREAHHFFNTTSSSRFAFYLGLSSLSVEPNEDLICFPVTGDTPDIKIVY